MRIFRTAIYICVAICVLSALPASAECRNICRITVDCLDSQFDFSPDCKCDWHSCQDGDRYGQPSCETPWWEQCPPCEPTLEPGIESTIAPTAEPTEEPTEVPTTAPTAIPTVQPTAEPTAVPTAVPTAAPTAIPTVQPTAEPTTEPTAVPTTAPTAIPTVRPTVAPTVAPSGTDSAYAAEVVRQVNEERAKYGLGALSVDSDLTQAAYIRAVETTKQFSHTRPDGSSWSTVSVKANGENIAMGYNSPDKVMAAWLTSEGHRANILRESFTTIGVCAYEYNGVMYWVQLFGTN